METQIRSFIKTNQGLKFVTIFGYTTKGVPGLEICGLGNRGRNIKEKITYLTKIRKLRVPLNRFVITIDGTISANEAKWLEFPILLIYWYLARIIPISKLDNCLCSGWISPSGEIFEEEVDQKIERLIMREVSSRDIDKLMLLNSSKKPRINTIDPKALLNHIPDLVFKNDYIDSSSAIPLKAFIT